MHWVPSWHTHDTGAVSTHVQLHRLIYFVFPVLKKPRFAQFWQFAHQRKALHLAAETPDDAFLWSKQRQLHVKTLDWCVLALPLSPYRCYVEERKSAKSFLSHLQQSTNFYFAFYSVGSPSQKLVASQRQSYKLQKDEKQSTARFLDEWPLRCFSLPRIICNRILRVSKRRL